jgi:hypothetical protein
VKSLACISIFDEVVTTFSTVTTDLFVTVKSSASELSAHLTALLTVANFGAAIAVAGNTNAAISAGINKYLRKFL